VSSQALIYGLFLLVALVLVIAAFWESRR